MVIYRVVVYPTPSSRLAIDTLFDFKVAYDFFTLYSVHSIVFLPYPAHFDIQMTLIIIIIIVIIIVIIVIITG